MSAFLFLRKIRKCGLRKLDSETLVWMYSNCNLLLKTYSFQTLTLLYLVFATAMSMQAMTNPVQSSNSSYGHQFFKVFQNKYIHRYIYIYRACIPYYIRLFPSFKPKIRTKYSKNLVFTNIIFLIVLYILKKLFILFKSSNKFLNLQFRAINDLIWCRTALYIYIFHNLCKLMILTFNISNFDHLIS